MNINQIQLGLEQAFIKEQHRIVFWYDPEKSFSDDKLTKNDVITSHWPLASKYFLLGFHLFRGKIRLFYPISKK